MAGLEQVTDLASDMDDDDEDREQLDPRVQVRN